MSDSCDNSNSGRFYPIPFGLGKSKPKHFREMLRIAWENRDNMGYAWRILKHGVYHTKKNLGVDESVMWGEYFFVEALTKLTANQFQRLSPEALAHNAKRYAALNA